MAICHLERSHHFTPESFKHSEIDGNILWDCCSKHDEKRRKKEDGGGEEREKEKGKEEENRKREMKMNILSIIVLRQAASAEPLAASQAGLPSWASSSSLLASKTPLKISGDTGARN